MRFVVFKKIFERFHIPNVIWLRGEWKEGGGVGNPNQVLDNFNLHGTDISNLVIFTDASICLVSI